MPLSDANALATPRDWAYLYRMKAESSESEYQANEYLAMAVRLDACASIIAAQDRAIAELRQEVKDALAGRPVRLKR